MSKRREFTPPVLNVLIHYIVNKTQYDMLVYVILSKKISTMGGAIGNKAKLRMNSITPMYDSSVVSEIGNLATLTIKFFGNTFLNNSTDRSPTTDTRQDAEKFRDI